MSSNKPRNCAEVPVRTVTVQTVSVKEKVASELFQLNELSTRKGYRYSARQFVKLRITEHIEPIPAPTSGRQSQQRPFISSQSGESFKCVEGPTNVSSIAGAKPENRHSQNALKKNRITSASPVSNRN